MTSFFKFLLLAFSSNKRYTKLKEDVIKFLHFLFGNVNKPVVRFSSVYLNKKTLLYFEQSNENKIFFIDHSFASKPAIDQIKTESTYIITNCPH